MIKFPNLDNYISDYNNPKSKVIVRIGYNPKNPNLKKYSKFRYFSIHSPFSSTAIIEMLNNYFKDREIEVEAALYNGPKVETEEINIWQLVWFVKNITEYKLVKVTIHTDNPNYDDDETLTINLSSRRDIDKLLSKLEEYSS